MICLRIRIYRCFGLRLLSYVCIYFCLLICAPRAFSGSNKSSSPAIAAAVPVPPAGSWEFWIKSLKESGKDGLPGRPDGQSLDSPLPTWVDCHLSRYIDQPLAKKNPLFSKLVLRSTTALCAGQLEDWAP